MTTKKIEDYFNFKNKKVFLDKKDKKNAITFGVINGRIDSLYKKYNSISELKIERSVDFIDIYTEKFYLIESSINQENLNKDFSINKFAIIILNEYFNFIKISNLANINEIKDDKDFYSFLEKKYQKMKTEKGGKFIGTLNEIYFSMEDNILYPSYIIKLPIKAFVSVKFFFLRHNGKYIFGSIFYDKKSKFKKYDNIEDLKNDILDLIFNKIYYMENFDTDRSNFVNNIKNYENLYKINKY